MTAQGEVGISRLDKLASPDLAFLFLEPAQPFGELTMVMTYDIHDWSLRLPPQTPDERRALKLNMTERVLKGMAPLEIPIMLLNGKIVDGRHRYEIWQELAKEGACDGYFAKHDPWAEEVKADDGESMAALHLRLHSRNLCHRSLSADQRAAQLLLDIQDSPELKALVDQIEAENDARMKAGKARETDSQGSTNKQLGKMIGTSDATVKKAKAVQKYAPEKMKDVAQGKTTANKVLIDVRPKKKKEESASESTTLPKPQSLGSVKIGDKVFTVRPYDWGDGDIHIEKRTVTNIVNGQLHFEGNMTKNKSAVFSREEAEKQRKVNLADVIKEMTEELAELRKKLNPPHKNPSVQKPKAKAVKKQATPKTPASQKPATSPELKVV